MVQKMFKVISPVDKDGGGTWWMRCGSAFLNKDNSINVYLDAMPLRTKPGEGVKLQLREFTDEELRERADKKAAYTSRGTLGAFTPTHATGGGGAAATSVDAVPF